MIRFSSIAFPLSRARRALRAIRVMILGGWAIKNASRRVSPSIVALLLAAHSALLAQSARVHSPTMLEPKQLVAGIGVWKFGRFDLFKVNPPFVRMIAAIPVLATDAHIDDDWYKNAAHWSAATISMQFVRANGGWRSFWYFTLARWACIPLVLVGALTCLFWSRDLYGPRAGISALALWSFDPNILGHGSLITNDIPAASFGLLASYLFWRWLRRPTWRRALIAGGGLGFAELSKLSWLILFGVWPVVWLGFICLSFRQSGEGFAARRRACLSQAAQLVGSFAVAIYLLNLGYGFSGTLTPLKDFRFVSKAFTGNDVAGIPGNRFSGSLFGRVPLPLPREYVLGIDLQRKDFDRFDEPSYLRGEWKQPGWWYYYLYGLAVKTPHSMQLLILLGVAQAAHAGLRGRGALSLPTGDLLALLVPSMTLLMTASLHTEFNHHVRYVWPCIGFMAVFSASVLKTDVHSARPAVYGLIALFALSSLTAFPHGISYFNELAGGPSAASKHLLHSGVDWGQDVLALLEWAKANPDARPLYVAVSAPIPLSQLQAIGCSTPAPPTSEGDNPADLERGYHAVSFNYLMGAHGAAWRASFATFRDRVPTARIGYSINVYRQP